MKKILLAAVVFVTLTSFADDPITGNEKAMQAFAESFKGAREVVWNDYKSYYHVRFLHNDIKTSIKYDGDGNILESTRYYKAENLPFAIRAKIARKFSGKTIFGITEIATSNNIDYYIVLEDEKTWTKVKSDIYGNMEVYEKFRKA